MQNKNSSMIRSVLSFALVVIIGGISGLASQASSAWVYCANIYGQCYFPGATATVKHNGNYSDYIVSNVKRGTTCDSSLGGSWPYGSAQCWYDDTSLDGTLWYSLDTAAWFRPDIGITHSSNTVSHWISAYGTYNLDDWGSTNQRPTLATNVLNGNPVLRFARNNDANDDRLRGGGLLNPGTDYAKSVNIFAIYLADSGANNRGADLYSEWAGVDNAITTAMYPAGGPTPSSPNSLGTITAALGNGYTNSSAIYASATGAIAPWNKPTVRGYQFNSTSIGGDGMAIRANRNILASDSARAGTYGAWNIGSTNGNASYPQLGSFSGYLAELLIFKGDTNTYKISTSVRDQIETYLMVKYGIAPVSTNANLYNTANGLVWNASTSGTYNNNIFGIGRDMGSTLNSSGAESTTNTTIKLQASTGLTNQQYLMLGDNNGAITWGSTGINAPVNMVRLNRMWYAQKTGPTDTYTTAISISTSQMPTHGSNLYYVAVDSDTDFSNATIYPMTSAGGRWTASGLTIANGQYITLIAGVPATSIGDRVWIDANKNGIQDGGETNLASITVTLRSCGGTYAAGTQPPINYNGTVIATTTTNAGGIYNFIVAPGIYYVEFTIPSSYKFTTQHAGGYGTNTTTNSDAYPYSAKTRCENFASNITDTSIDAGVITQTYSSCDSLTLSNVATVGVNKYQKPGVSFTVTLAGYGQNASLSGVNIAGGGSNTQALGTYNRSPTLSSSVAGTWTINAAIDGYNYKLDYYSDPAAYTNTCMYRTISAGTFCAEKTALAPYIGSNVNMNNSPTTVGPITYCTPAETASYSCTAPIDAPQSSLVKTLNTCTQTINIVNEAYVCSNLVTDMSAADCNALIALYNNNNGASWTNKTNWLFNGDTSWNTACDWYGVSCAGGRVTRINLSNNNVVGTLTHSSWTNLSSLTGLKYLAFASNTNLSGTLPTTWSSLVSLTGLVLSGTKVSGALPTTWSTLTSLTTFNAYNLRTNGGGLTSTIPSTWSSMPLVSLYLSNNNLNGQLPSWVNTKTSLVNIGLADNNFDGPVPDFTALTSLATAGYNSTIGSNCMGTGNLTAGQQTFMDARFKADGTTSWNNAALMGWRVQKACATDLRITSMTITAGDLVNGNSATYSITVGNSGSRYAYAPRVAVSMGGNLVASSTTLTYNTLAPGASQTLTFTVTKGSVAAGTNNITNTFTVSDATITDTANNVATHIASVRGSTYSICNNSTLTVPIGECEILGDFYTFSSGSTWTTKTNWTTSANVGTWHGVTVAGGRVTQISLASNNVRGVLTGAIGGLSELTNLTLNNNTIGGNLPSSLGSLSKLVTLRLDNNNFNGSIPTGWGSSMSALKFLHLNNNTLTNTIPTQIASMPVLEELYLNNNSLTRPTATLKNTNNTLKKLHLNNNSLTSTIPAWIFTLTNLTELILNNNTISGNLSSINSLNNLVTLNVANNNFSSSIPNITITTLQHLIGNNNSFSSSLPTLPTGIKTVILSNNNFTNGLPAWPNGIAFIALANNQIEGQIPTTWSNMTSLTGLNITGNNIEGVIPVATLQAMTSLSNNNIANALGNNCMYTGSLLTGQISYLTGRFSHYTPPSTSAWQIQKACGTDLEVVSATPVGTLQGGSQITYTVTIRNNGPRIAYDPRLNITLTNGLQFSDSSNSTKSVSLGQMTAGQTVVQTIIVNKLGVGSTTINYTNTFAVTDASTTDSTPANNSKTHAGTANGSAYPICLNPATTVIQSDCEALGDLYTATAGSSWTNNTNWLSSTDVESWFGVTVAGGRVTRICLNRTSANAEYCSESSSAHASNANNLNGSIPASIGNLTALNYLFLSRNVGLVGSLPSTIENLDSLTHLYINNNTGLTLPSTGDGLNALQYLIAYNAGISGPLPSWIASLPAIIQLQFSSNTITSIPDVSARNSTLRVLYLQGNSFTGTIPSWIGSLTNLTHLGLGSNAWTSGSFPSMVCSMPNLQYLYLYGMNLIGTVPTCVNNLANMIQFQIYSNQLEGDLPNLAASTDKLTHYYVHANRFTSGLPTWFGSTPNLRYVYMYSNRLTGPVPNEIANMTGVGIIFRIDSNNLDRNLNNQALFSPTVQSRWNNATAYLSQPANYMLTGNQGDITAPLLGANAKRLPTTPSFNYNGKSITQSQITGPNGSPVVATLLGGSPHHVGYDATYHTLNLQNGKTYTLSFWARTVAGSRNITAQFSDETNGGARGQTYAIDTNWKQIVVTTTYTTVGTNPRIFITNDGGGSDFYYYDPVVTESTNMPTAVDTNAIIYPLMITDGSDWDSAGRVVSVGGGGSCSNLTVTPNKNSDRGLALYYNFDDSTATDDSTNGLNGTLVNTPTFVDGKGGLGKAVNFDGTQKRIVVNNATIPQGISDFTYSWWTKWNGTPSLGSYFENGSRGNTFLIRQETSNLLYIYSMSANQGSWTFAPVTNQWYHMSIVRSGNQLFFYVDGVQVGSPITFNVNIAPAADLWIGASQHAPAQALNAAMDDIRIYNRALSATEIAQMYNTTINISAQGTYNACYLTTTDRGSNTSNAVRLGDFTATFSPYPICNNPARTVPQSECTALMDLYTSTAGASWNVKTNWNTNPDMGTWRGVTVTNGHVTHLCLNRNSTTPTNSDCSYVGLGNNLVGTISSSLGDLPYMKQISLSNNAGLTGPIPSSIGNLVNMTQFYVINSNLNGSLPESMTNLNSLTNLYLWSNQLSGSLPSSWGTGMAAISYIYLAYNHLSGPIPANWANMANRLDDLILSNQLGTTKLNGTIPSRLGNFNINLHLRLDGNQFSGPIPPELGNISSNNLFLNNNQLSGPIPPELANNTTMVDLRLQNNNLNGSIPESFTGLNSLTTFYIQNNNLDRDLSNNAIIPAALTTWYNARATKDVSNQTDVTAPVISGNPLAGTYSFNSMSYTINMIEASAIATGGMTVVVGGGGTCSQITVAGTLTNGAGANTVTLQFAPGSNATTAYSNCTLSTTDRASLVSNTINLGNFSVKLNPFPICNNINLTVSQEQCGALMDFYTNLSGSGWTNKTNRSAGTTVGNWYGVTTANSLVSYYNFDASSAVDSGPNGYNGTNNGATFVAGKNNNGAYFDGASRRIVTVNQSAAGNNITRSAWVNREQSINGYNMFMGQYLPYAAFMSNGKIYWSLNINGVQQGITSNATLVDNTWYHITLTYDGSLLKIYINGTLDQSISMPGVITYYTSNALTIGDGQNVARYPFKGKIDDVRVYNRTISADEANQLYLSNQMGSHTVTQLRFTGANNMIGTFPNVFDRLPSLTAIEINSNAGITGPIPATISNLPKLVELGLSSLGVNGSLPSTLPTTLTSLSLNTLTSLTAGPLPSAWSLLTNLTYLSVQNINANGALPASWSSLVNLYTLHLANNNFNSQIPTSWLTALTNIGQMYWEGANIDGPLPPELASWNINTSYTANYLTNNCFGTGHLTPAQVNAFDTKYTRAKWAPQRACSTDLGLTVSQAGSLTAAGNGMLYTITVTNNGSRWAYSPRVAVSLGGNLRVGTGATTTLTYTTLAPGASQTQTISVVKSATSPTTSTAVTNTFTLSDPTITDSNAGNNTVNDSENVQASTRSICNHYALNTTVAECEALSDLYTSTAGASWTNKTNWLTSPNFDSWYGVTMNQEGDLIAHYTFDASNATDDAGNGNNGTLVSSPTFGVGRLGNAINFDGTQKRVVVNNTNIPKGTSDFTYSRWTKRNATPSYQSYFENGLYTNGILIRQATANLIDIYSMGSSMGTFNFAPEIGQWYHLSVVRSGNILYFYINGVQAGSLAFNINMTPSADLRIGASQHAPTQALNGSMDDVRIYSRGLSATEVTNLYQTANPVTDRVTQLKFGNGATYGAGGGNNLSGTLPANLTGLTELTHFWVDGNAGLVGQIPSNFWNMTKIQDVRFMYTQFTGSLPTFGSSYPSLNKIIMSHTRLSGQLPTTWGQNTALTTIWLGSNPFGAEKITGNLPSSRGSLVNMDGFAIYYAGLTGSIPSTYGAMTQMSNFQLQGNQLSGPLPSTLSQWATPYAFYVQNNQLTGNLSTILSGWNANTISYFGVSDNNFDRDHNNNAILPSSIVTRGPNMTSYYINNQGDITPPVLTFGSKVTNVDDVVEITFTLTEGSSTTGAGYLSGLDVAFTGSAACASLDTSPVRLVNKGSLTVDVIGAAGTYAGCSMYVRDRANLISNLMSPGTITIPNYAICGVVTDMARGDCKALVDIYTDTNGSGWNYKANWMGLGDGTPTTACDWQDVTCAGNRVGGLVLGHAGWHDYNSGKNLSGTLPATLGNLTGLTQLIIASNPNLVGNIPTTISNLKSLTILTLYYNSPNFGGVVPTQLSQLTGLQGLTLAGGGFSGTLDVFTPLQKLTSLNLAGNKFTGPIPPSFGSMTGLTILYLYSNFLTGPIPSSLGNLTNMVYLHLSDNSLSGLIPASLASLVSTHPTYPPNLNNNCLSTSTSYMTTALANWITNRSVVYTTQKACNGTIGSRLWIDSDNDGRYDNGETGTGGVTVTLRSCSAQAPVNTGGKLLNHQLATYYTFDANNTIDDSFNGNDGVNNGATFAAGKMGSAASFNGSSNYITTPTVSLTNDYTISLRTKYLGSPTDAGGPMFVGGGLYSTSPDHKSYIWYRPSDNIWRIAQYNETTVGILDSSQSIEDGQYHHIVVKRTGVQVDLYVDGVLKGSASYASVSPMTVRTVGWSYSPTYYTNGQIDDIRIYSRALSATEISQLYNIDSATPAINFPISNSGAAVATTTSAANGTYSFTNQPAGRYYLEYSNVPNGYKFTTQNWGGYHNTVNSDVNPWSAKTSCFELYNGLYETDVDAGLKYLPYSSCENTSAAYTPTLLGQPVTLSIGGYGSGAVVQAINTGGSVVLNVGATSTGAGWGLKTWNYSWTPGTAGTYIISGAVDGYNYKFDYYNNPALANLSCAYRTVSAGVRCAMSGTVAPYSGTAFTNVNQIASIPAPMQYCSPAQISGLPCSTAGDQPPAMVVQSANTCTSSLVVTSDVNVMCDAVTDMQPAECKALVSLYDSTAGASWTNKTNRRFLGDTTPRTACDWTGVVCGGGRVNQLRLGNNNLNGTLPALTGLNAMSRLIVSLNPNLKGNLPSSWSSTLTGLTYLYAWGNAHTGTLPTSWATWPSMQQMYLNDNQLTGGLPASWSSLTNLTNLALGGNPLGGTLPSSWSSLTKLVQLGLPNTQLTGTLPSSWSSLNKLTDLSLNTNNLQGQIPASWLTLTGLVSLSLVNNELDGPIPVGITSLSNLVASAASDINQNCMGASHVSGGLQSFLNVKFPSRYASQKTCQTDLQLSFVSKTGTLTGSNNLTYVLRYHNNGARRSYNTQLSLSMLAGLGITTGSSTAGVTTTGIRLGILAPGASGNVTFVINKGTLTGGTFSTNNNFDLVDTTVSDINAGNNSYDDNTVPVLVSTTAICNNPALTIPIIECETLFTFYNNLGGASWITKTNWNANGTNANAGTWHGVTVSGGNVSELNYLTANNMVGTMINTLNNLTQLRVLRIYNQPGIVGQLSGNNMTNLTNLRVLELSGTSMAGPVPAAISNLTQLKLLTLIGNKPTTGFSVLPSTLRGMTGLTGLYLSNNYFGGQIPSLTGFTSLQNLALDRNSFVGTLPTVWAGLPLKTINVKNNLLTGQIPTGYTSLAPTLNRLIIDNNEIDGQIPGWLTGLVNLQ